MTVIKGKEPNQYNRLFLTAKEVAESMSISIPMAYKIIRKLNDELESNGYLTISGKINRRYFESKIYGGLIPKE